MFKAIIKKTLAAQMRVIDKVDSRFRSFTAADAVLEKILVVDTASIGDMVCALPAVNFLRKVFPDAELSFAVSGRSAELFYPLLDKGQVYTFGQGNFFGVLRSIRKKRFDAVLVLSYSLADSFIALFSRHISRYGFLLSAGEIVARSVEPFADVAVCPTESLLGIRMRAVGVFCGQSHQEELDFYPLRLLAQKHNAYPDNKSIKVLFAPFSKWESKNWPLERWVELAKWILAEFKHAQIYVTADADNTELVQELCSSCGWRCASIVKESNGLAGLASCIAGADVVFCVDSAPLHFAGALGVPRVGLYGPTDPGICGPVGNGGRQVIVRPDVLPEKRFGGNVSGWQKTSCRKYMEAISVESVQTKSRLLLNYVASLKNNRL